MKTTKLKIEWPGGRNSKGYITDFRLPPKGAEHPTIGTALYVALSKDGSRKLWSERRAMPVAEAKERGLLSPK